MVSTDRSTCMPVFSSPIATPKRALDLEHELEHVDRIEPEAVVEQRRGVADLLAGDRQPETADDGLLDFGSSAGQAVSVMCINNVTAGRRRPPMTWPVM